MAQTERTIVPVNLGARSYNIIVGADALTGSGAELAALCAGKRCAIVTDETVAQLHLEAFTRALTALKPASVHPIILPAGEATKNFAQLENLCAALLDFKITRADMVIALGGGVIGDLTGFAAAVLRRGVDFIQVPTTLLAQVDSSVGGKTAINMAQGKNLIGAFYQPRLVLADTSVLATLAPREMLAGFAEVIKYGLINDPAFFGWLIDNGADVLAGDAAALAYAVSTSCAAKAAVVAADERETGQRALLNLGHTFGHAIEAHGGYDGRILHGEAVSIGMAMAHDVSAKLGFMPQSESDHIRAVFGTLGLPTHPGERGLGQLTATEMVHHMGQDKKNVDSRITLILSTGIGAAFVTRDISSAALETHITQYLMHHAPQKAAV